ncbi:Nuclear receptor subfamily 1 group D member 2 [Chelonia mydas]|uniref:Nuclear receptor subfamily 1 group D member 2 n=1 Tax=Chelonia mydas TaxID=8469 RepID=M7BY17_CHEMY|nr:Nuclear receptor subfamily 1 group D member 2 [Chelonia mydas]
MSQYQLRAPHAHFWDRHSVCGSWHRSCGVRGIHAMAFGHDVVVASCDVTVQCGDITLGPIGPLRSLCHVVTSCGVGLRFDITFVTSCRTEGPWWLSGSVILYVGSTAGSSPTPGSPPGGYLVPSPQHSLPSSLEELTLTEIGAIKPQGSSSPSSPKVAFQFPEGVRYPSKGQSPPTQSRVATAKQNGVTGTFSTVRFGRIPKREKQRLMDEMQSYMSSLNEAPMDVGLGPEGEAPPSPDAQEEEAIGAISRAYHDIFACPLNASPHCSNSKSSQQVWEEFSQCFTPAVKEVVEFAKSIPGFQSLCQQDQVMLLKAGTFQVLMVRFSSLFNPKEKVVTFLSGETYSLCSLRSMGMGCLLDAMFEFSEKLGSLGLDAQEMALFMAVVLVSADRSGISDVDAVEILQETLIRALRTLVTKKHPDDSTLFPKLLLRLPDLRTLNNQHSEKLLAFRIDP